MRRYFIRVTFFEGKQVEFYLTAVSLGHAEDQVRNGFDVEEVVKVQVCAAYPKGEVA